VTLADIGFVNGLRFSPIWAGASRDHLFVPLPQDADVAASELVLVYQRFALFQSTMSAPHEARRNLEVQVNDRTVAAIALDGKSRGRTSAFRWEDQAQGRLPQALISLFRRRHARSLHRRALRRR
jgi:hypothetical protein